MDKFHLGDRVSIFKVDKNAPNQPEKWLGLIGTIIRLTGSLGPHYVVISYDEVPPGYENTYNLYQTRIEDLEKLYEDH